MEASPPFSGAASPLFFINDSPFEESLKMETHLPDKQMMMTDGLSMMESPLTDSDITSSNDSSMEDQILHQQQRHLQASPHLRFQQEAYSPRFEDLPLKLIIHPTPQKSRVETQVPLTLEVVPDDRFTHIRFPQDILTKPRTDEPVPQNYLDLHVRLTRATPNERGINETVHICSSCMVREKKRAMRKKRGGQVDWNEQKSVIFNCREYVRFVGTETDAAKRLTVPMRILCYCRHYREREGFIVNLQLTDPDGLVMAAGCTAPIMITDDHKTTLNNNPKTSQPSSRRSSVSSSESRKRKASSAGPMQSKGSKLPQSLAMTTLAPSSSLPNSPGAGAAFSMDVMPNYYSAPSSATQSRANSPVTMFQHPTSPTCSPTISKLIPGEGSTRGGTEVTILGSGFQLGLVVKFGDTPAIPTIVWSSSTLICVLPPAAVPGPVLVSFEDVAASEGEITLFNYVDDTERALMELALQVVGLKMTGRLEDAHSIAMRIVAGPRTEVPEQTNGTQSLEGNVLKCVDMVDFSDSNYPSEWNHTNKAGQTLLHLAAILGYNHLTAALLARGAYVEPIDRSGCTPLHFASQASHLDLVKRLLRGGGDIMSLTNAGNTAIELSTNAEVLNEITARRRQLGRLSRSSSTTSIASMNSLSGMSTGCDLYYDKGDSDSGSDEESKSRWHLASKSRDRFMDELRKSLGKLSKRGADNGNDAADGREAATLLQRLFPNFHFPELTPDPSSMFSEESLRTSITAFHAMLPALPTIATMHDYFSSAPPPAYTELFPSGTEKASSSIKIASPPRSSAVVRERRDFARDRMLLFFWLPMFLCIIAWCMYRGAGIVSTLLWT